MTQEDVKRLAYTVRQINSVSTSLEVFNFVLITAIEQMEMIANSLSCCFDTVEMAFAIKTEEQTSNIRKLHAPMQYFFRKKFHGEQTNISRNSGDIC